MRILVAIDNELSAETALEYLQKNALVKGNEFKLLHVVQPSFVEGPIEGYAAYMGELQESERQVAGELLARMRERIASDAQSVETEVHFGPCATVIAEECTRWNAEMAVAATHARQGFSRFWFGSVATEIAGAVPCSVVVLRMKQPAKVVA